MLTQIAMTTQRMGVTYNEVGLPPGVLGTFNFILHSCDMFLDLLSPLTHKCYDTVIWCCSSTIIMDNARMEEVLAITMPSLEVNSMTHYFASNIFEERTISPMYIKHIDHPVVLNNLFIIGALLGHPWILTACKEKGVNSHYTALAGAHCCFSKFITKLILKDMDDEDPRPFTPFMCDPRFEEYDVIMNDHRKRCSRRSSMFIEEKFSDKYTAVLKRMLERHDGWTNQTIYNKMEDMREPMCKWSLYNPFFLLSCINHEQAREIGDEIGQFN